MKLHRFAAVAAVAFVLVVGCQPVVVTTPAKTDGDKDKDIHIRTPRANVDVEGKGSDRKVDVDVHPKGTPR